MKYYFLTDANTGDIILSSSDKKVIEAERYNRINKDINEYAEEEELDIDDMTPDEVSELALSANADYEIDKVEIPNDYDENETFTTDSGDEYTFNEVLSALDEDILDEE